ncbi:MAG: hypothetical protein AB1760_19115 [Pseudomonadota bacterium]
MSFRGPKSVSILVAALALILGAAGCSGDSTYGNAGTGTESGAPARQTFGTYSPGTLGAMTPEARELLMQKLGVTSYEEYQRYNINLMLEAGATWARQDFEYRAESGFTSPDDYLGRLRGAGFEVVGCARPAKGYAAGDLPVFEERMRRLVEAHPYIRTWQIGNEPSVSLADPETFPAFFLAGSAAVREACPDCRVILGGAALRYPNRPESAAYFERTTAAILAGSPDRLPFDAVDFHFYGLAGDEDVLLSNLDEYKAILARNGLGVAGLPPDAGGSGTRGAVEIWITETATYTGRPTMPPQAPPQSQEQQAEELVRRFATALGSGVERISWSRPYENYGYIGLGPDGFYDLTALVYNGLGQEEEAQGIAAGTKKKSYFAFRTLARELQGYESARMLSPSAWEFAFAGGRRIYIVWDGGDGLTPEQRLPEDARGRARVTDIEGNPREAETSSLAASYTPVLIEPPG